MIQGRAREAENKRKKSNERRGERHDRAREGKLGKTVTYSLSGGGQGAPAMALNIRLSSQGPGVYTKKKKKRGRGDEGVKGTLHPIRVLKRENRKWVRGGKEPWGSRGDWSKMTMEKKEGRASEDKKKGS